MQKTHEQNEIHDRDPVVTWQLLIQKWDEAYSRYRAAMETCARNETLSASADEQQADEAKALADLTEIKQQIDQLIAESNNRRSPILDSVVVGTIETGGVRSNRADDEVGAPRLGALAPRVKLPRLVDWILRRCSVALQNTQDAKGGERYRNRDNKK